MEIAEVLERDGYESFRPTEPELAQTDLTRSPT
jgi:hypothetical protein